MDPDPEPICPERFDPDQDPVCPERFDPVPDPVISDRIRNPVCMICFFFLYYLIMNPHFYLCPDKPAVQRAHHQNGVARPERRHRTPRLVCQRIVLDFRYHPRHCFVHTIASRHFRHSFLIV